MKRYRRIKAKAGSLIVEYGRDEDGDLDLVVAWGGQGAGKCDAQCNF